MDTYEEKYKEIVGQIRKAYLYAQTDSTKAVLEEIFPELAESEDEKIRHFLMNFVKINDGVNLPPDYAKKALAWIEKQGKQKASYTTIVETGDGGINALVTRELPIDGCDNEQNPDDKVEPEFNVGDWIVQNGVNRNPVQITSFEEDKGVGIKVWFSNDTGTYVDFLKGYHKWTIQDAKEGDVLISKYRSMCIFKDNKSCYCYIDTEHKNFYAKNNRWFSTDYTLKPATKEQRDLLFQKMHEAGYTFDFEKKELKKIEPKTKENKGNIGGISSNWSENDEEALEMAIIALEDMYDDDTPNTTYGGHYMPFDKAANQLKSLKGRVQPKPMCKFGDTELTNEELCEGLIRGMVDEHNRVTKEVLRTEYEKGRDDVLAKIDAIDVDEMVCESGATSRVTQYWYAHGVNDVIKKLKEEEI